MILSKYQKSVLRAEKRQQALVGKGLYVYRNNTSGDLYLPRPTHSGIAKVKIHEEFQGDDYYMFMVRSNELRLIRVIETPQQQAALNETMENNMSDKLITEQPPVVTNEGTVEYVQQKPDEKKRRLNENLPPVQHSLDDILLSENPLEGIEII